MNKSSLHPKATRSPRVTLTSLIMTLSDQTTLLQTKESVRLKSSLHLSGSKDMGNDNASKGYHGIAVLIKI